MVPERFQPLLDEVAPLATRFDAAGFRLYLVGGSVRDAILGRIVDVPDLDFTTDAPPDDIERIVRPWADAVWLQGKRFGTIGALKDDRRHEITTHRADVYLPESRKPEVSFSDKVEADLAGKRLRTPLSPEESFADDPLRMLRAARFLAGYGLEPEPGLVDAVKAMHGRLSIVSAERIRDELDRLLVVERPGPGLWFLVDTGLAGEFLPELPALALEQDPVHHHKDVLAHTIAVVERAGHGVQATQAGHGVQATQAGHGVQATQAGPGVQATQAGHGVQATQAGPDRILRLAALLHDIGKPRTRAFAPHGVTFHHHEVVGARMAEKRMRELHYPVEDIEAVRRLVELHLRFHGYGDEAWTDSAVRRYARDAGPLLDRLNQLTRADCTTRNRARARELDRRMDLLESRIAQLREEEELDAIRPDLDGHQVMQHFGVPPGPLVGQALAHLLEARLDEGPLGEEEAYRRLDKWWAERQ